MNTKTGALSLKLKILFYVLTLSAIASTSAQAACNDKFCEGSANDVIRILYLSQGQNVWIEVPAADGVNLNCNRVEGKFLSLKPSHGLFKEVYSTLLTAVSQNLKVRLRIVEGSSDCEISYVFLYNS